MDVARYGNCTWRSATSSSVADRHLLGAEQRDEHDEHDGEEQHEHLPRAAENLSHDVRPVMRAEDVPLGRVYSPALEPGYRRRHRRYSLLLLRRRARTGTLPATRGLNDRFRVRERCQMLLLSNLANELL
jgi:hypothetical protein